MKSVTSRQILLWLQVTEGHVFEWEEKWYNFCDKTNITWGKNKTKQSFLTQTSHFSFHYIITSYVLKLYKSTFHIR